MSVEHSKRWKVYTFLITPALVWVYACAWLVGAKSKVEVIEKERK